MNNLFKRISLPYKLLLLALIPLTFLIFFAYEIIREKNERITIVNNALDNINRSLLISEVARQITIERRITVRYYLKKITDAELISQYSITNSKLAELKSNFSEDGPNFYKYTLLYQLINNRNSVLHGTISFDQILNYYTNLILRLLNSTAVSIQSIPYLASINKELSAETLMSQYVNYFGLVRAKIYLGAVTKQMTQQDFDIIQRNTSLMFAIRDEYRQKAPLQSVQAFDSLQSSSESTYLNAILKQVRDSAKVDISIDPEKFWNASHLQIEQILTLQDHLMKETGNTAHEIYNNEHRDLLLNIFLLLFIIILVVAIVVFTIIHISKILTELRLAAEKIAKGSIGIELPVYTNDAIGSLSESINNIDENNKKLTRAAESIGRGDFSTELQPRSEEDILGIAILKMKNELSSLTAENKKKIWLQTGVAIVSDSLLGDKDVASVAKDGITVLVQYLNAQTGLFYDAQNNSLKYLTGYGVSRDEAITYEIRFGETLLGEAAVKKQPILLTELPKNFIKITSASGEADPKNLIIAPLVYEGIVEGVIELGSLYNFHENTMELLTHVAPAIALAIFTAKNRARLQDLFEETQAQSEELQAQHSEMENINAELEAQTQKLQASEDELKVQQEELMQANQELEERSRLLEEKNQLIVERNLDIQKKSEELELSTKYKSEFLANMSHELRTPLNSILLLSRLLSENNTKNLSNDQVESAHVIQNSGKGLLTLIDEILDLSKIESGKMDLEYQPVHIETIASNMRQLFQPIAKEKNLEFDIVIDAELPQLIETDQLRLEQILKNMLSNALKFTTRGSVKMGLRAVSGNQELLEFYVKDTGVGIPADKQQVIFEAFQQADGSTRRKFGGTGLGLSISRELAKLLGGTISVKSNAGGGSEFAVTIPTKKVVPVTPDANDYSDLEETDFSSDKKQQKKNFRVDNIPADVADDREAIDATDKIILIVEDDTAFAKSLLKFTHQKGYKGIVVVRGDKAVEMALQYRPVAILLDIQLPMKDGWEVMDELKSNPQLKHIPVHMMSSMEAKRESISKGAIDFISKPMALEQMQEVFKTLEKALQHGPKKVLIVEENPKHAKALSFFLESFNITSEIKQSIKEAVSALKDDRINCVILDMGIPDNKAYETLEQVKKSEGLENLPVIIFTGKHLSKTEEGKIRQYADSIVVKTANSYQRILDEVGLFLHLVEDNKGNSGKKADNTGKMGVLTEVLKNKTVLVADDDVRNIFSLTKALEQQGMKVISAMDGKDALNQLEQNPGVDVVLMDMMMPEMDGYETTKMIRKNPKFKNLPILAVTAKAMVGDREKCIRAGASDYISKPVDIDQLISLLRVWLYDKNF
ncbi:response regulator [soil metagenome]